MHFYDQNDMVIKYQQIYYHATLTAIRQCSHAVDRKVVVYGTFVKS